jgi:hypothetical protein
MPTLLHIGPEAALLRGAFALLASTLAAVTGFGGAAAGWVEHELDRRRARRTGRLEPAADRLHDNLASALCRAVTKSPS